MQVFIHRLSGVVSAVELAPEATVQELIAVHGQEGCTYRAAKALLDSEAMLAACGVSEVISCLLFPFSISFPLAVHYFRVL